MRRLEFGVGAPRCGTEATIAGPLEQAQLHEGRDLKPTTDVRSVLKGLLADQFGLSPMVLGSTVFPDSLPVQPLAGLVA